MKGPPAPRVASVRIAALRALSNAPLEGAIREAIERASRSDAEEDVRRLASDLLGEAPR